MKKLKLSGDIVILTREQQRKVTGGSGGCHQCPTGLDAECPSGQRCFKTFPVYYCGKSFIEASGCAGPPCNKQRCSSNSQCPSGVCANFGPPCHVWGPCGCGMYCL